MEKTTTTLQQNSNSSYTKKQLAGVILASLLMILCMCIFAAMKYFQVERYIQVVKLLTSLGFIVLAILNHQACPYHQAFFRWLLVGFIMAFWGDFFLAIDNSLCFILGAASFAMGHVFYSIAYTRLSKMRKSTMVFFVLIGAFSVGYIYLNKQIQTGSMAVVVYAYAIVISVMLAIALGLGMNQDCDDHQRWMVVIGSILFYVSDFILVHVLFMENEPQILTVLNTFCYYPAQMILAFAVKDGGKSEEKAVGMEI